MIIMNLWNCRFSVIKSKEEAPMPHAIQIRQTGGPEVLNWIRFVALRES